MKKLLLLIVSVILLSACSSKAASTSAVSTSATSTSAVQTVKQMYEAALNQDSETFQKIMSQYKDIDGNYSEALSELADIVHSLGGTEKLSFEELKDEDIQKEVINHLDNKYENGWKMVLVSPKNGAKGDTFAWLLDKVDGDYYVLEGDEADQEEILKIVNGKNIEEERTKKEKEKANEEEREKNNAEEQFKAVTSQLAGQTWTWSASNKSGQIELSFTDVVVEDIHMDEFPSYISVPIKATAKLTDIAIAGQSELLTTEMTLEGTLSTHWDNYFDPKEALEDLRLGLEFKEFTTTPSIDIPTDTFGFSTENLNLNSDSDWVTAQLYTAPWTGTNYSFTIK